MGIFAACCWSRVRSVIEGNQRSRRFDAAINFRGRSNRNPYPASRTQKRSGGGAS